MNKRKLFLLPIFALLLGACTASPSSESKQASSAPQCEHQFDEGTITVIPTCTEEGEKTQTCALCGATQTVKIDANGHTWDEGTMTKRPTTEEAGVKTYHCTVNGCNGTKEEAIAKVAGYTVTFQVSHCKVKVFQTQNYSTEQPQEVNSCLARDENGNAVEYDYTEAFPQPQVSFKVICDDDYSVNTKNITVTGTYKNIKQNPNKSDAENPYDDDGLFRITKIESNLTVAITAVQGEQAPGNVITFVTTNCSVKVYVGPKNTDGTNVDAGEDGHFYSRAKDSPYDPSTATDSQFNFEVVCANGYEFKPVITDNKVDFIQGTYNKFQDKGGYYNLTKVSSDLVITITATPIA